MCYRTTIIALTGLCVLLAAATSQAAEGGDGALGKKSAQRTHEPTLLTADDLTSDESLSLVVARGHVDLVQGERKIQADVITYNQKTKVVIATGNVRLFEPDGEVMFSDYAELTDDLKEAFIHDARVIMSDASRTTGTEAARTLGRYTRMNHVTYSPCYLCSETPGTPPVWQLRADKSVHDNVDKDIRYTDAYIDLLGIPVFYAPYFSTPDPTVKRRSGFLTPIYGSDSNLGFSLSDSYYFDINPDLDATLKATYYTLQGPMLGGEVRKRFDSGLVQFDGELIHADSTDASLLPSGQTPNKIWRGYANGSALFDINDTWRMGGDLNIASDPNYLRQYYSYSGSLLTSRLYAEDFFGRDYATIRGYHFQDLRFNNTQAAPNVAPLAQYSALGEPDSLLGGRWSLDTGLVGLTRTSTGPDQTRFSLEPGWARQLVSDTGLVTTVNARARADIWNYQNYQRPESWNTDGASVMSTSTSTVGMSQGSAYRAFPQGQVKVSYPLVRNGESTQTLVEPMAAVTAAPRISQNPLYPNEDSQDVELDATSLFQMNRFVGQDRQEGGQRVTYGVRTGVFGFNQGSGSVFFGQDYRLDKYQVFDNTTGLADQRSDYVGQIDLSPASWLYLNYHANLHPDTFDPRRETITAAAGVPAFNLSSSFHYDQQIQDPVSYQLSKQEYTTFGMNSQISRYWSASFSQSLEQLPVNQPTTSAFVLTYSDECLIFQTFANINWAVQPGLPPGQTVYFRLVFKGLGEVKSPGFSLSGLEGSSPTTTH